jgi:hypothetical protein
MAVHAYKKKRHNCIINNSQLITVTKIIAVDCKKHINPIDTLCGRNTTLLNVETSVTYN